MTTSLKWLVFLGLVGCGDPPSGAPAASVASVASVSPGSAPPAAAPSSEAGPFDPTQAPADGRSAAELAAAWVALMQEPDEDARLKQADALGLAWQHRRYTWTGLALASLCQPATHTCAVQAFTADLPGRAFLGGSMPLVRLRAAEWPRIAAACGGQPSCVLRFEAALVEARTDPEQALRLVFTDGRLLEARLPTAGEPWFRPPPAAPATVGSVGSLRTGEPVPPPITLTPKVF